MSSHLLESKRHTNKKDPSTSVAVEGTVRFNQNHRDNGPGVYKSLYPYWE